jgi:hypothetical protein
MAWENNSRNFALRQSCVDKSFGGSVAVKADSMER